jgi:hypothetical protein
VLNFTRWLPEELDGLEQCSGLPPAGPTTCTMMMSSQVQLAQTMPAYLGGGTGAILTLSQSPCATPGACCNSKNTTCAYWAGAHLVSAGCIQYGILEIEAAFSMPANAGGFYFTAMYGVCSGAHSAWNEIDFGMINNVLGQLELHTTAFTAAEASPTATVMDALNFAESPIGTSLNVNTTITTVNGVPSVPRYYNTSFAIQFHTYKVVWTQNTVAWLVDTVVYRNITYAPWRPMSIRQILRTNKGVNAVGPWYADSNVYIRRIRYTPYSTMAVADAYRCSSMFACYGALAPPALLGVATTYVSLASGGAASGMGQRRKLLQLAHADERAALETVVLEVAVASVIPGMPRSNVTATPTAFSLSFRIVFQNLLAATASPVAASSALGIFQADNLQNALVAGIAGDVIPRTPGDVVVQSIEEDPTQTLVYVSVLIMGYADASDMASDYTLLNSGGAAHFDSTATAINNALGLVSNTYLNVASLGYSSSVTAPTASAILANAALCPSYPGGWDATCLDASGNPPSMWCTGCVLFYIDSLQMITTYGVTMPVAASAVGMIEAQLSSAIATGALEGAIAGVPHRRLLLQSVGGTTVTVTPTSTLLIQRILTSAAAGCASSSTSAAAALRGGSVRVVKIAAAAAALLAAAAC